MGERGKPEVYSIAAHRGFADALVAGLATRYSEPDIGLARLTLLLPSTRAARTVREAFIRHFGAQDAAGMLMPRMAVVGDLDIDETLGSLLDPLGAADIPPAVDPTRRWLRLAELIREEADERHLQGAALLRLAQEFATTMDRLLVEEIGPEELIGERVLDTLKDLADHWKESLRLFARVQAKWRAELEAKGEVDAATRRNLLFRNMAKRWQETPPATPIVAAGVTSAAPALANLLRIIAELPQGAVVLPDFDLTIGENVWDELGRAGVGETSDDPPFARGDAVTHPQYHLKLLLNRMGVNRAEVEQWHRKGMTATRPERSHAIGSLFLPPEASKVWVDLDADKRRLSGVRMMTTAHPQEEAQAIALLVRQALEVPERRVAVVTPDRGLARRVAQHLGRWNIVADDSAGQPLAQMPTARVLLLLAEVLADHAAPVPLMALLEHPLVHGTLERADWLDNARLLEREMRGPRPSEGLEPLRSKVAELAKHHPEMAVWWDEVEAVLSPLLALAGKDDTPLAEMLDLLAVTGEALCGEALWTREDGRALSNFIEDLRLHARDVGTRLAPGDLHAMLREAMERIAVRPPWGGHPRVAIYGLLESRMSRADLVICGGLNEGSWPASPSPDPLLAPAVLRALGVPGADFRIGLAAHDLAGALGAPEVVLSRAQRDESGPTIPSRFLMRVEALLGELADGYRETEVVDLARAIDAPAEYAAPYPRPAPDPSPEQRDVPIAVTALDRLLGDPYQFYAGSILKLRRLDGLDAEPTPAWQGELAHKILEQWHEARKADPAADLHAIADRVLDEMNAHPLMKGLWRPRLMAALDWVVERIAAEPERKVVAVECKGSMVVDGVLIHGRADRIDCLPGGGLAIVDYKTGKPPSGAQVEAGYALQLGLIGLIAEAGGFDGVSGDPVKFEYWSLSRRRNGQEGFGFVESPVKSGQKKTGFALEEFLPRTDEFLHTAIEKYIKGSEPFKAKLNPDYKGYSDFDQLMRLDEWLTRAGDEAEAGT